MYGYHAESKPFVKVYVRHPTDVQKVAAVLEVRSHITLQSVVIVIDFVSYRL